MHKEQEQQWTKVQSFFIDFMSEDAHSKAVEYIS